MNKFFIKISTSFLFIFSFYSYANDRDSEDKSHNIPSAEALAHMLKNYIGTFDSAIWNKAYLIDLFKRAFPLDTDTANQLDTFLAKDELRHLLRYINEYFSRSRGNPFAIEVAQYQKLVERFVDALFHEEKQVRTNAVVFVSDIIRNSYASLPERLLLGRLKSALGVKTKTPPTDHFPSSPFVKKEGTITPEAKMALHVLENIQSPVGRQDFEFQTAIFDIIKFLEKHKKVADNSDIFASAVRALVYINPLYPTLDKFLTQVVLREIEGGEVKRSASTRPPIKTESPVEYKTTKDKDLIRVSPSSYDYMEELESYSIARSLKVGRFIIDTPTTFSDPIEGMQYMIESIRYMKHLLKTAPSSLEFLRFLVYSFTSPDIYLRSTAMNIAKGISINEEQIMSFLIRIGDSDIVPDPADPFVSEHKSLALRLWILIDPKNPKLEHTLEIIADDGIDKYRELRKEARKLLRTGIISSEIVFRDPIAERAHKCQSAFYGKAL